MPERALLERIDALSLAGRARLAGRLRALGVELAAGAGGEAAAEESLVAFVVVDGAVGGDELRSHLAGELPPYMLPAGVRVVERLPVGSRGKVDLAALAALAGQPTPEEPPSRSEGGAAPRSATERAVAALWQELLGVEAVPADRGFFALGGHSLLAMRLVARLRERFGVELAVETVFEQPTVARLAAWIDARVPARAPRDEAPERPRAVPLARYPRPADPRLGPPLGFAQQRLWYLDRLEGPAATYNVVLRLDFDGPLAPADLAAALTEIVRRHEVLRTTFPSVGGEPVQRVAAPSRVPLPVLDLSRLAAGGAAREESELARWQARFAHRTFDLARERPVRWQLARRGPACHVLLAACHHIAFDGWSRGVFLDELEALLRARRRAEPPRLAELPVQSVDVALWQRRRLEAEGVEARLAFWRRHLEGAPVLLPLPADRPRSAPRRPGGHVRRFPVPEPLAERLRALGREREAGLFVTVLTGFAVFLARHAGATDVVVGVPVAQRDEAALQPLIGFFTHTLPLRIRWDDEPSFETLLGRVRRLWLDALEHRDLPFERLVEAIAPPRAAGHSPIFQVLFVHHNASRGSLDLGGTRARVRDVPTDTAKFDLTLTLEESEDGLEIELEAARALFRGATVAAMEENLLALLDALARDPGELVARLRLVGPGDLRRLAAWQEGAQAGRGEAAPCPSLFAAVAAAVPERVAVVADGRCLTYGALERRSRRIAHRLRSLGVGPERRVGLLLPRSPALLEALLGVLRCGATVVPLDPSYPESRLRFIAGDAGLDVLIAPAGAGLGFAPGLRRLDPAALDASPADGADPGDEPLPAPDLSLPIYLLYTSGSTGRPKGVALPHRALAHLVAWQRERSGERGAGATAQLAPLSFDVSFQEIFSTWAAGGTLVLVEDDARRDPRTLLDRLERHGVERLFLPFVALQSLAVAAAARLHVALALREVITAGEALEVTGDLAAFFARLDDCRLDNQYGPTETHVVSARMLTASPATWPRLPPIGRPVDQVRLAVLDRSLRQVPVRVPGELCIGGPPLARGYAGRPGATAERFVPDPTGGCGRRLYRSGDLARWSADGELEFLGRIDGQLKVRGFRIEPGEVEVALTAHPEVTGAAVAAAGAGGASERFLVAYVTGPIARRGGDADALGRWLRERLPEPLVPSRFVWLEELPRTASGKVDRARLPEPRGRPAAATLPTAPRDDLERDLLALWRETLVHDGLGVDCDFFASGGHSLLAVRLLARVEERFGVDLPVAVLFSARTVAAMAGHLRQAGAAPAVRSRALVEIAPGEGLTPLVCVHPGGGQVLCYSPLARALGPGRPLAAFEAVAPGSAPDGGGGEASVEALAAGYVEELCGHRPHGPILLAGWSLGGVLAFEMARQLARRGRPASLLALLDSYPPEPGAAGATEAGELDRQAAAALLADWAARVGRPPAPDEAAPAGPRELWTRAHERGLLPAGTGAETVAFAWHALRRRLEALTRYRPAPCPVPTLLVAATRRPLAGDDPRRRWRELVPALEIEAVPADHFTLMTEPAVRELARRLGPRLELFDRMEEITP